MLELASVRSVWAIDTPGYGMSDPLPIPEPTAGDYADALAATIEAIGLHAADVYGAHTGAKIVLELAVRRPDLVRRLVLDGLGLYTPEERTELLDRYTPPLEPELSGDHLLRYWHMQRDMHTYWPWYRYEPSARMKRDLPDPPSLHRQVVDFLMAGEGYWKGYRAAFSHDTERALAEVSVPTLIVAWSKDPLRAHLDRFDPSHWVRIEAPSSDGHPVSALARSIVEFLSVEEAGA